MLPPTWFYADGRHRHPRRRVRRSVWPYLEREPRDMPLWLARVLAYGLVIVIGAVLFAAALHSQAGGL
jgi:hypothetical protein